MASSSAKPSGGAVVRMLRAAPGRNLPIKTLRKAVSQLLECEDNSDLKKGLKEVLSALEAKGRVKIDGKVVHLPKSKKDKKENDDKDDDNKDEDNKRASKKAKTEPKQDVTAAAAVPEEAAENTWGEDYGSSSSWSSSAQPNKGDTGTRVFLGNLSFKIDEVKLKNSIPGITHIKWITDKDTQQFYGTAFIELATPQDAKACVGMAGSNILGRPLKANLAPPRPGDIWPPVNYTAGGVLGDGGKKGGFQVKPLSPKPNDYCKLIFCGNLSYDIDDDKLAEFFKECGELAKIRWLTHVDSGDFKGCGYVEFWDTEAADKAVLLNGTTLLGRPIRIDWDSGGKY